jgi:hypothetical protein
LKNQDKAPSHRIEMLNSSKQHHLNLQKQRHPVTATMFRALLVLLLPVVSPSKRYDFFPDRPSNWKSYQKQMWLTRQRNSTILLAATDQREHWGMDTAPWEMVELIDSQCPDHGCDTSITVQNTVLVRDNCPPEVRNVTMRVHGHFEKQGPVGKKGDFIEALKALLRASHDPLQTEYVEVSGQFVGTGNISETCKCCSAPTIASQDKDKLTFPRLQSNIYGAEGNRCEHGHQARY